MFVMGQGVLMLTISLLVGLLAGVALKVLGKGFAGLFSANIVMSLMSSSMMLPLWTSTEEYLAYCSSVCDAAYIAHLKELSSSYWL